MIDTTADLAGRIGGLAQVVGLAVAAVFVIVVMVSSRGAVTKVISIMVVCGLFLFAVFTPSFFKDKVGEDLERSAPRAAVVDVPLAA